METSDSYLNRQVFYLDGYRKGISGENVSKSILRFKAGNPVDIDAWTGVALLALLGAGLQKEDMMIRALGHQETGILWHSVSKPMDLLCQYIAENTGYAYGSDLARKTKNVEVEGDGP